VKILCLCSALVTRLRYGCTPAWRQLLEALDGLGHEVVASAYQGATVESPWWRGYANPCAWEGRAFAMLKKVGGAKPSPPGVVTKSLIARWIRPRWERHIARILETEKDVGAVIVFTIPANHFTGLPERLRAKYGVPFFYYDGDVPASLPRFGGFASGFSGYEGASLAEYDGVLCNSEGGAPDLAALGAKRVETVHWGADPDVYRPIDVEQDRDVFFYGLGTEYREQWIEALIGEPSRQLANNSFAVGGHGFGHEIGNARQTGSVPFSGLGRACCRSRINLNITREAHATVYASSSMRPFELAAMGCCIVSNPHAGLETWFDVPGQIRVVNSVDEAIATYRELLEDPGTRHAMGQAARQRVLDCHTYRHRAKQIARFIS